MGYFRRPAASWRDAAHGLLYKKERLSPFNNRANKRSIKQKAPNLLKSKTFGAASWRP